MVKIKKERAEKKTNRKQNFKKFIESGYTSIPAFVSACKNDEDLLIYTCLKPEELEKYFIKLKEIENPTEQIKFLINNQPYMNESLERYNRCVESVAKYLKGYISYNGFVMSNRNGNNEDWEATFWLKFCKICEFYRVRWFFPERLEKKSTVVYNLILYKEFLYMCRSSITLERKHLAFLATQDWWSSIFGMSLDTKIDTGKEGEKTLADVIPAEMDDNTLLDSTNVNRILDKALLICKKYKDAVKYADKIKQFYENQDPTGFDKKTIILGKIFLYKAGLISPKILSFIKSLSPTYKIKYSISEDRIDAELEKYEQYENKFKPIAIKNTSEKAKGWRELIFRKRGELNE